MVLSSSSSQPGLQGDWLDDFARGSRGEYPLAVKLGGGALFGTAGLILEQVPCLRTNDRKRNRK